MAKYSFTIKEVLRSQSKWQGENFSFPNPEELIDDTVDKFWNFDAINQWQVFSNPNRNQLVQAVKDAQNNVDQANGELTKANAMLTEITTLVATAKTDMDTAKSTTYNNTATGKYEAYIEMQLKIQAAITTISQNLELLNKQLSDSEAALTDSDTATKTANEESLLQFEKTFLLHFYDYESKFDSYGLFKTRLKSWWREYLPEYSQHLNQANSNMYVTVDMLNSSAGQNTNKSSSNGLSNSWGTNDQQSHQDVVSLQGNADTPQNRLDLDLHNLKYATTVAKGETITDGTNNSVNVSSSRDMSEGTTSGSSKDTGSQKGRQTDIFQIIGEWTQSNFSSYLDILDKMDEHLFLQVY